MVSAVLLVVPWAARLVVLLVAELVVHLVVQWGPQLAVPLGSLSDPQLVVLWALELVFRWPRSGRLPHHKPSLRRCDMYRSSRKDNPYMGSQYIPAALPHSSRSQENNKDARRFDTAEVGREEYRQRMRGSHRTHGLVETLVVPWAVPLVAQLVADLVPRMVAVSVTNWDRV